MQIVFHPGLQMISVNADGATQWESSSIWSCADSSALSSLCFNDLWSDWAPVLWLCSPVPARWAWPASRAALSTTRSGLRQAQAGLFKSPHPSTPPPSTLPSIHPFCYPSLLPPPHSHLPLALKAELCEPVAWQSVCLSASYVWICVRARVCSAQCLGSLEFVSLSTATLSFIRACPAAHRLSVYSFIVSGLRLLEHVGGWFLTHGNLGSPRNAGTIEDLSVSGHWKRTRRQAVMMSESFTPTHASSAPLGSQWLGCMHSHRRIHKCEKKVKKNLYKYSLISFSAWMQVNTSMTMNPSSGWR